MKPSDALDILGNFKSCHSMTTEEEAALKLASYAILYVGSQRKEEFEDFRSSMEKPLSEAQEIHLKQMGIEPE